MPNHVINEIIIRDLDPFRMSEILAAVCNGDGIVDFEVLLPPPLNSWPGSVRAKHEKAFKTTHLDWATQNWGTKWNAYGTLRTPEVAGDVLTLRFDTAWRPPYGWLVAIFNKFRLSFTYNYLSEGEMRAKSGSFNYARLDDMGREAWSEEEATDEVHRHLHLLRWGVEEFEEET